MIHEVGSCPDKVQCLCLDQSFGSLEGGEGRENDHEEEVEGNDVEGENDDEEMETFDDMKEVNDPLLLLEDFPLQNDLVIDSF